MKVNYAPLKAEIALPAYNGMTDAQIAAAVNAKTIPNPKPALIPPTKIVNAIVPADLVALSTNNLLALTFLLSGSEVDGSPGSSVRAGIQAIFSGKTTTLQNLAALVIPFDNAADKWTEVNCGLPYVSDLDVAAARNMS